MIISPFDIGLILILVMNLSLGIFVYLKNRKDIVNKTFLGITLSVGAWLSGILVIIKMDPAFSLFGGRLAFTGASLIPVFSLLFSFHFPKPDKIIPRFLLITIFVIGFAFSFVSLFTPLLVEGEVTKIEPFGIALKSGPLYPYYGLYFIISISWVIFNLIRKLKITETLLEKRQIKMFLLGGILSLLPASLLTLILPLFFNIRAYTQLGPFAIIFFIVFTTLAITRYHLFEIKAIFTELLVAVIGIILAVLPFAMPTGFLRILTLIIFFLFCICGYLLIKATHQEIKARGILEQKVRERTKELQEAYEDVKKRKEDLEKFYKVTVGRELKMVELKKRIKELEEKLKKE